VLGADVDDRSSVEVLAGSAKVNQEFEDGALRHAGHSDGGSDRVALDQGCNNQRSLFLA